MKTYNNLNFFCVVLCLFFASFMHVAAQTPCASGDAITTRWDFATCAATAGSNADISGGTVTLGSALSGNPCNISSTKLRLKTTAAWNGNYTVTEAASIPFTVNTGRVATITSISIDIATGSGTAATGYKLEYSTNGIDFTDIAEVTGTGTKVFTFATPLTVGAGAVTLRFMAKGSSSNSRNLDIDNIVISGTTCSAAVVPILTANPTAITGLQKNLNSGTNTPSSFTLTGTSLTANATLTVTGNYEISTDGGTTWGTTGTINQSAGGINQAVQVRIAAAYNTTGTVPQGTIAITNTGANTVNVTANGTVVNLTPLATPAAGTASAPTETGFTATWTATTGATGYTIKVYQGSTVVRTLTGVSGTTTAITGLSSTTAYTFSVTAEGNGTTSANSAEGSKSNTVTTLAATTPPSSSPCAVMLYKTDFSDWIDVAQSGSSSNAVAVSTGAGAGFTLTQDMTVNSSGKVLTNAGGSSRTLTFKAFNFVNGGTVIIKGKNTTTSSMGGISGVTTVTNATTGAAVTLSTVRSSDANGGAYYLKFELPTSVNGSTALTYDFRGEIYEIIICTNPGPNPQIATVPVNGGTVNFSAEVGGNTNIQYIDLKGFNLTGDVQVTISGSGAGRFTIPSSVITKAIAMGSTVIPVTYTSSVLAGTHDAVITFTSPGANSVSINLHGTSKPVGGGCSITTSTGTLVFATRLIMTTTNTIVVSGVNLTGNVSLSITGAGAAQFSLSQTSVTAAQANGSGKAVTITYTGGTVVGTHAANLVITSGSCSITVPLQGNTMNYIPAMYTLTLVTQPANGGTITTDIAGPQYPSGTIVKLTAVAETGYKFVRWSDISSYSPTRNIKMDANKTIIAIFAPSSSGSAIGDLEAYNITSVTTTGFTANWKAVTGATQYTIKVYEQDANGQPGALVKTQPATGTSVAITGLTTGKAYFYQVVANTSLGDTSEMMGSYPIGPLQSIICGQD